VRTSVSLLKMLLLAMGSVNGKRVPTAPSIELVGFQRFAARDTCERGEWIHGEQHYEPKSWITAHS
jgi:hypothetical protein